MSSSQPRSRSTTLRGSRGESASEDRSLSRAEERLDSRSQILNELGCPSCGSSEATELGCSECGWGGLNDIV
jgi:hypothetical protein